MTEKGENECYSCGQKHTQEFPDGFPDNWKFCCCCRFVAEEITAFGLSEVLGYYKEYRKDGLLSWWKSRYYSGRAIKLKELITIA